MKTIMEKEIFSQSTALRTIEANYIKAGKIEFFHVDCNFDAVKFIASGSSYNAIRLGAKFFENYKKGWGLTTLLNLFPSMERKIKKGTLYVL